MGEAEGMGVDGGLVGREAFATPPWLPVPIKGMQGLYFEGDRALLEEPCVAVVGSRDASEAGLRRARRLGRELAAAGVVVVSGLARGIDHAAHLAALEAGGRTIAVIGTPLDQCSPKAHWDLQRYIGAYHLVISPFPNGSTVAAGNFPMRNRVIAALTQASVIVEATHRSGTQYVAAECRPLARPLFIAANQVNNPVLQYPAWFAGPRTHALTHTQQILDALRMAHAYGRGRAS